MPEVSYTSIDTCGFLPTMSPLHYSLSARIMRSDYYSVADTSDVETLLPIPLRFVSILNAAMDELDDPQSHFEYDTVEEFLNSLDDDID